MSKVTHRNINGLGPDTGPEYIRFETVGAYGEKSFDVLVSNPAKDYVGPPSYLGYNGVWDGVGLLYMNAGTKMNLKFSIVEHGTETLLELPKFYMTYLDIDTGSPACRDGGAGLNEEQCTAKGIPITGDQRRGAEVLTIKGGSGYFVGPDSELMESSDEESAPGTKIFTATVFGDGTDNPWYVATGTPLSAMQMNRVVTVKYEGVSEFELGYESVAFPGLTGREMLFAGKTDPDACEVTRGFAAAPTDPPESVTTTVVPY
jgi:hypothetical protein